MKNGITILSILLIVVVTLLTSCSKDEIETNQNELLGTWISTDKSDTLYFVNIKDFYRSNGHMVYDHFDYKLFKDSIEIGYSGKMYILVMPTMHKYSLDKGKLTIDFGNKRCYGFDLKEMTYTKEK